MTEFRQIPEAVVEAVRQLKRKIAECSGTRADGRACGKRLFDFTPGVVYARCERCGKMNEVKVSEERMT